MEEVFYETSHASYCRLPFNTDRKRSTMFMWMETVQSRPKIPLDKQLNNDK